MGFKLIRTDSEDSCKIQLCVGTHLFGRGKFLDCDDKRISRNHGNLIVTENSVTIESLHTNPCFFTKKGSTEIQVLKKSCSETLSNGDKFGLLPGSYWFELLHCTESDHSSQVTEASEPTQEFNGTDQNTTNNIEDKTIAINTEEIRNSNMVNDQNDSRPLDFDLNETFDDVGRSESPSLLDQQNPQTSELTKDSVSHEIPLENQLTQELPSKTTNDEQVPENQPSEEVSTLSMSINQNDINKRSHDPDEPDHDHLLQCTKKIKTENSDPGEVKTEPVEIKKEPEDQSTKAGPSRDQVGSSNAANTADNKANGLPASPAKPPNPGRERCMYGASCYRKNPQHKAQFSHPQDSDWGAGDRGVCPFGHACQRRDPRHWRDHEHPPGTVPPRDGPRPGMQVVQRHGNVFYINAHSVNFYDDHFQVEDSDGDSVDFDYEF